MLAYLIAVITMLVQGIPVLANQGGTITGTLRDISGQPVAGIRVAAEARPDVLKKLTAGSSFAGLAETDSAGRFRLENVPPGRYYVVAGRVDALTYYPGSVQVNDARPITLAAGATISGIDFALSDASFGRAGTTPGVSAGTWIVPIQVSVEGGKIPLFVAGKFPVLRLTRGPRTGPSPTIDSLGQVDVLLFSSSLSLPWQIAVASLQQFPSATLPYVVTVQDLPKGYQVTSLTFGMTDLTRDAMALAVNANSTTTTQQSIKVVLSAPPLNSDKTVRVSGRFPVGDKPAIFISGHGGTIYADGTYEFVGVPPGLHRIAAVDTTGKERPHGAEIVVGDRDLSDVNLEEVRLVPADWERPGQPLPAGNLAPGTYLPLLSIRGRVVDSETKKPISAARVLVNGGDSDTFSSNDDGRFEVPRLLRGEYLVTVSVPRAGSVSQKVVLDSQDAVLEFSIGGEATR